MAALAWKDAEAMPFLSLGLITDLTDDGVPVAEEFGPYSAKEAARIPYGTLLQTIERILGKKTRSEKTGKEDRTSHAGFPSLGRGSFSLLC